VTSLSVELGREITVDEVAPLMVRRLSAALDGELPVTTAPQSATPPTPVSAPGVRWELAPALRG